MPAAPSITIRATGTRSLGLGPSLPTLNLTAGQTRVVKPVTLQIQDALEEYQRRGYLEILSGGDEESPVLVRQQQRRQLVAYIGNGSALPNDTTLHTLTLGGVAFQFGDGQIDGANAAAIIAAFQAALAASTAFTATKLVLAGIHAVGTNAIVAVFDGDYVQDWAAMLAASSVSSAGNIITMDELTPSAADSVLPKTVVTMQRRVTAADVTRGYIAFDTGLTDLNALTNAESPSLFTLRVSRSAPGTQTLTASGNLSDGATVTIGTRVYTARAVLGGIVDEFLIGASASDTLDNLIAAINATAASAGVLYDAATTANTQVSAAAGAGDTMVVTALLHGTAGNAIATTETSGAASWGASTLAGGADATPIYHNGSRTVVNNRVVIVTNDGTVDFAALDLVQITAIGTN